MKDVIEVVEMAFAELQRSTTIPPQRATITISKAAGWMCVMLAYLEKMGSLSTKIVIVFEKNLEKKLPTIMATVVLNSAETGGFISDNGWNIYHYYANWSCMRSSHQILG